MMSCLAVRLLAGLLLSAAPEVKPTGVLLILADDQGPHLGCLGTRGLRTPHLDALAAEGVLFTRAYATCASCSPARSALLTGRYPHSNGHWRNTHTPGVPGDPADYGRDSRYGRIEAVGVHEDIPTLVEILGQAGWVTGLTQKFHLSPPWKYPFAQRLGAGSSPRSHAEAVTTFLAVCGQRPFFLMANVGNTHRPFGPHLRGLGGPPVDPNAIDVPENLPDTPFLRRDLAQYLTAVGAVDACVGAILEALRAAGRYEQTLIVFTSDQGYAVHRAKATAYDLGLHVPLIVAGPGVRGGRSVAALVSHVDVVPTLLAALGQTPPADLEGLSLGPWLGGAADVTWRSVVFAEHNAHGPGDNEFYPIRSAFDGRFHYLQNLRSEKQWTGAPEDLLRDPSLVRQVAFAGPADAFPGGPWDNHSYEAVIRARDSHPAPYALLRSTFRRPAEELYDLGADPFETVNRADDPALSGERLRLREQLDAWRRATRDPGAGLRYVPRRRRGGGRP